MLPAPPDPRPEMASSTRVASRPFSSARSPFGRWFAQLGLLASFVAGAIGSGTPRVANAQTTDAALAESLFQEGKRLMDAGKLDEACPKLAESHKLDPAGGTVLAAAMCFEKAGRVASAWAAFTDALAIANRDRRADRAKFATEQLGALELRLPRVTIDVPLAVRALPNVALAIDGRPLPNAAWDGRTPVDPGAHVLTARADGYDVAEARFSIAQGELKKITAPTPPRAAAAPKAPPPATSASAGASTAPPLSATPETPSPPSTHPTLIPGLAVGGVGLVAIAVGAGFGASALSKTKDANDRCPRARCADKDAIALNDTAGSHATLATILVPVGVVTTALGVFLAARTAPGTTAARSGPRLLQVAPHVGRDAVSLQLGGAF